MTPGTKTVAQPLSITLTLSTDAQSKLVELLAEATGREVPAAESPALLDRSGLARALSASVATVDRLVQAGLPSVHLVDARRFILADVLAWLRNRESGHQ